MESDVLYYLGMSVLASLPLIAVWIVGIVLSIVFMKRHRRVSMFALTVFILCLINMFFSLIPSILLHYKDVSAYGSYMMIFSIISTILSIVCWSLIIAAVFVDRNNPQIIAHADSKKNTTQKE